MAVDQDIRRLERGSPFASFAYVDVNFTVADAETSISHEFKGVDPESIRWIPLTVEGKAYLYRPIGTRNAWDENTIWLSSSAVSRARLLLVVEHE